MATEQMKYLMLKVEIFKEVAEVCVLAKKFLKTGKIEFDKELYSVLEDILSCEYFVRYFYRYVYYKDSWRPLIKQIIVPKRTFKQIIIFLFQTEKKLEKGELRCDEAVSVDLSKLLGKVNPIMRQKLDTVLAHEKYKRSPAEELEYERIDDEDLIKKLEFLK